jgi:hypothetical protein
MVKNLKDALLQLFLGDVPESRRPRVRREILGCILREPTRVNFNQLDDFCRNHGASNHCTIKQEGSH